MAQRAGRRMKLEPTMKNDHYLAVTLLPFVRVMGLPGPRLTGRRLVCYQPFLWVWHASQLDQPSLVRLGMTRLEGGCSSRVPGCSFFLPLSLSLLLHLWVGLAPYLAVFDATQVRLRFTWPTKTEGKSHAGALSQSQGSVPGWKNPGAPSPCPPAVNPTLAAPPDPCRVF